MHNFAESPTRELEINDGSFHLYLSKNRQAQEETKEPMMVKPSNDEVSDPSANNKEIKAPLVGTVYLQPKPDAEPYVKVGDAVKKGDVVCVIEAMKMMTEIKSEFSGIVKKIQVSNEELVEVNQPLLTIAEEDKND